MRPITPRSSIARSRSDTELNHQYSGGTIGSLELVPQLLFLDTTSNVSQQNVSAFGAQPLNNINTTGNRTTVRTTVLSPTRATASAATRTPKSATPTASWTPARRSAAAWTARRIASTRASRAVRRTGRRAGASNTTGRRSITIWPAIRRSSESRRSARRLLTPVFALVGTLGYEDNNYLTTEAASPSGSIWTLGFNWTPTPAHESARIGRPSLLRQDLRLRLQPSHPAHGVERQLQRGGHEHAAADPRSDAGQHGLSPRHAVSDALSGPRGSPAGRAAGDRPARAAGDAHRAGERVHQSGLYSEGDGARRWGCRASAIPCSRTFMRCAGMPRRRWRPRRPPTLPVNCRQTGSSLSWSYRITPYTAGSATVGYSRSETATIGREDRNQYARLVAQPCHRSQDQRFNLLPAGSTKDSNGRCGTTRKTGRRVDSR